MSGIPNTYDNTSTLQQHLHQSTVQMPVGYVVSPNGRTGAELRVARGAHELLATGKAARLGKLLPHLTTTTNTGPNGHPLEVRLPFALVTWLILGTLTITDEVAELLVYMHVVGAERLGAACDMVLTSYDNDDPVAPSVLRRYFLDTAETLRVDQPVPFTVTASCLLLVGGMPDNLECQNLAVPVVVPPLSPAWFVHIKFKDLAPKSSLLSLSEAESLLAPRWLPVQRSAGGGASQLARLLLRALPEPEREIIEACGEQEMAEQFATLFTTLLPSAAEMVEFTQSRPAAALALSRAFGRATLASGSSALQVSVHEVVTVIAHFDFARLGIGTEVGAPAALGMLHELVRVALKSTSAPLTLGNITAAAEVYKYLTGRLTSLHASHTPPSERVAFLYRELGERRQHEAMVGRGAGASSVGAVDSGAGTGGGTGGAAGGGGYAPMYVSALCDIIAHPEFVAICAELTTNLDAHAAPGVSIERILAYRGVGAAVLHHALRGYVSAVRDVPLVFRIVTELRPHGPQWVADKLAELSLPPETDAAPRIIPSPLPELWNAMCKSLFSKLNIEDLIYAILAQCGGHDGYVRVPDSLQFTSIERLRRTERTIVPFFGAWGYEMGGVLSLDTLYATAYTYYDDATAVPVNTRMVFLRSVFEAVHRESGAREAALLGARKPDEALPTLYVIPNSGGVARLQRGRLDTPTTVVMARALSTLLGPTKAKTLGLGGRLVPEGMQPGAAAAPAAAPPGGGGGDTGEPPPSGEPLAGAAGSLARKNKAEKEAAAAAAAADVAERAKAVVLGSALKACADLTSVPGSFGIGREGSKRRFVNLDKFYSTPGVPEPPGGKGVVPPLNNPGPLCCPVVWASRSEGFEEAFCTAVGKPGHGRGGTAHCPPVGWRKKYLAGLLCVAAATGDAAFVGPPAACAAARDATPFDFTGAGGVVARSTLSADAPAFHLHSHGWLATPAELDYRGLAQRTLAAARTASPARSAGADVVPARSSLDADASTFYLPSLEPLADLAELDHVASPQSSLAVARFEAHGGHAYLPLWYPSPSAPHVAVPDASGCRMYGSDDAAVLALRGGPSREAALAHAVGATASLFGGERTDLVCFGFFRDAVGGNGEVAGFVASQPPPTGATASRYATLRAAAACGARGPLWIPVSALSSTPLGRLARLAAARARSFVAPASDFSLLGAVVGALAPRPVAPARGSLPVACATARLTPDEVKSRSLRAVSALQHEFRVAIAHGGYTADECAYLASWLGTIEPPEFGDMPLGLLEQATVPTDPLIRHVPYPAYSRCVTSDPLPPLPQPPPPLCVPGWATAWRHTLVPEAAELVVTWLRMLRDGLRRFAAGEPGERVARDMPPAMAVGVNNFSPWAAAVARQGHVIVRREGKFALLDMSQPPAPYLNGTGLNRAFLAEMLVENGSVDFALRDMLCTHGAVYLADLAPVLLLQPPLRSFFAADVGFASAHSEIARMAKMEWFDVHKCTDLDAGNFDLPCLPFRTNPSGAVARKLEQTRWRGIQDFGGPRRALFELANLLGLGTWAAHVAAFGPGTTRRVLGSRAAPAARVATSLGGPITASAPPAPRLAGCGGFVGCSLAAVPAAMPAGATRPALAAARRPRHLGHYFSGSYGLVGRAAHAVQWSAREADVLTGTDLSAPATVLAELARIERGDFGALALGPPCNTYSPNLAEGGGKYQLRDWERPDGRPTFSTRLRAKLDLHNGFAKFTADAALRQLRAGGELLIENSAGRFDPRSPAYWPEKAHLPPLWATTPLQRLRHAATAMGRPLTLLHAPQCAFGPGPHGKLYQKWTEFLVTPATARRLASFNELRCTCAPGAHTHARGLDASGASKATPAAAYPWLLCQCIVYGLTGAGERPALLGCLECEDDVAAPQPPLAAASLPVQEARAVVARAPAARASLAAALPERPLTARRAGDSGAAAPTLPPQARALVRSLNSASGVHQSRAARAAYAAMLRPGASSSNPRFTPALRRQEELPGVRDTFPAGLAEPAALGAVSWAGGRHDWCQELKPFFSDLLLCIVIIGHLAFLCGMDVYVLTDDAKDWFHQFCLAVLQCWACGMFRLDPDALALDDPEAALAIVLARCLEMGVSPSSNIAQRALGEILQSLSARFAASEEPHLQALECRFPAFREARTARRTLGARTGRDEARCHALLGYTDDVAAVLMGAAATVRYCDAHGKHLGPSGCNVTMAIAAKRSLGVTIPFIGATALTVGQLAYVSREKVHRTQAALASARDGTLALSEWVKLSGLLNHLVCVLLMPYYVMYGVYECLDDARTRGLGQDALLAPTQAGVKALRRWSDALTTTAGTTTLAALYPTRRPTGSGVLHVMHSDAAKEGTGEPAICGNLYSHIYIIPLRPEWRALPIVATEFIGGIVNVMIFAPMLHGAPGLLVLDALVVPTVIAGKASSPLMRYLHEYLVAMPEYQLVADTLLVSQEYGPYNPIADAGSRGKGAALESLMEHMGLRADYIDAPPRAIELLDDAAALWRRMAPGEREAHMQLELAGASSQPGLGATSRGVHNISMDGRPIAHAGVACGGFIGCAALLTLAVTPPGAPPRAADTGGAAGAEGDGAARCLLAADAVERRECASRVEAATSLALQIESCSAAARATLATLQPAPSSGGLLHIPGDPGGSSSQPAARHAPRRACNDCAGCLRQDCGACMACRDKLKFGGPNRLRRRCVERACTGNAAAADAGPAQLLTLPAGAPAPPLLASPPPVAPPPPTIAAAGANSRPQRGAAAAAVAAFADNFAVERGGEAQDERAHEAASHARQAARAARAAVADAGGADALGGGGATEEDSVVDVVDGVAIYSHASRAAADSRLAALAAAAAAADRALVAGSPGRRRRAARGPPPSPPSSPPGEHRAGRAMPMRRVVAASRYTDDVALTLLSAALAARPARATPLPFPSAPRPRAPLPSLAVRSTPTGASVRETSRWAFAVAPLQRYVYGRAAPLPPAPRQLRAVAPPAASGRTYAPPAPPSAPRAPAGADASRLASSGRLAAGLHVPGADGDPNAAGSGTSRISALMARAYAPLTNRKDAGHWRAWERVCAHMGVATWRTDMAANSGADPVGYHEEVYLMCMALILLYSWMKPRSRADPAADPRNAVKKLQAVRRIHRARWPPIEMVSMSAVSSVLKGMLREYIDTHGFRSLVPKRKLPLTNVIINGMVGVYDGARRGALVVARGSYYWISMLCLFTVLSETGMRDDEVTGPKGRNGLTFSSLTWKVKGVLYKILTAALRATMGVGDGVYLAHGLAKNDPVGRFFAATPSFLPWRAGGRCSCRALADLEVAADITPSARGSTPLFGPAPGEYFVITQVEAAFNLCLAEGALVPASELSNYSVHSFRIFVACALLAAGCPRWLIKRMLRWRGDESLEIYARVSDQEWEQRLSSVLDATVDASLVPRLPQLDISPEQESEFRAMAHALLGANLAADRAFD